VLLTLTYQDFPSVATTNKGANVIMSHIDAKEQLSWCLKYIEQLETNMKLLEIALALYDVEDDEEAEKLAKRVRVLITFFMEYSECNLSELKFNVERLSKNLNCPINSDVNVFSKVA
jgi:hypothetical protein